MLLFSKIKEFFNKKKGVEINHPEMDKYGLTGDISLWVEFNREKLVRNWIKSSRPYLPKRLVPSKDEPEYQYGTPDERELAGKALAELIAFGHLNPITYLKEEC